MIQSEDGEPKESRLGFSEEVWQESYYNIMDLKPNPGLFCVQYLLAH